MEYSYEELNEELRRNSILIRRQDAKRSVSRPGCCSSKDRALRIIYENPGIAQKSLADLMGIRPQTLGEIVLKLIDEELVERRKNTYDLRIMSLFPTSKCKLRYSRSSNETNCIPVVKNPLSPEDTTRLVSLLKKLNSAIETENR